MQQLVRIDLRTEAAHAKSVPEARDVLLELIEEARDHARSGDLRAARMACAEAMFAQQALLAGDRSLLAAMIAALVHARGFLLLSRLLGAIDGRAFRFAIAPGSVVGGAAVQADDDGAILVTLSEDLLAREHGIEQLSGELARLAR